MYAKYLILKIYMFRQCSYVMEIQKRCLQKFMYLMYLTYKNWKKKQNKTKHTLLQKMKYFLWYNRKSFQETQKLLKFY